MAFLDVKVHQEQHKFDWDDISVGNNQLDHSQNFFSKKHFEHERLDEMEILQKKLATSDINDTAAEKKNYDIKPKDECALLPVADMNDPEVKHDPCAEVDADLASECASPAIDKENDGRIMNTSSANDDCDSAVSVDQEGRQQSCQKMVANLALEWSTKKTICSKFIASKGGNLKNMPPPPQAYLVKDVFQRKREEAERRRAEEERKLREFHSRPAPKFNHPQERIRHDDFTTPVTPQVLKKSREAEEKRRKMLDEWRKRNQPQKFVPRPPTVLKEKPFVPEKRPVLVQQCPFKLQTEKRLKERRQYDELTQRKLEEKQKQEAEERERIEKERIRKLRKATIFKARPNPFKN